MRIQTFINNKIKFPDILDMVDYDKERCVFKAIFKDGKVALKKIVFGEPRVARKKIEKVERI